ncbi:hypothetical protein HRbin01_01392 [archaeon HR01]|nr:hypothetical protein HRbin01_01392 [archaeon HR01]
MEKHLFICSACGARYRLQGWKAVCPSCKAEYTLEKAVENRKVHGVGLKDLLPIPILAYTVLSAALPSQPNIFRLLSDLTTIPEPVFYALFLVKALTAYLGSEIGLIAATVSGVAVAILSATGLQSSGLSSAAAMVLGASWATFSALTWVKIRRAHIGKDSGELIEFSGWGGD